MNAFPSVLPSLHHYLHPMIVLIYSNPQKPLTSHAVYPANPASVPIVPKNPIGLPTPPPPNFPFNIKPPSECATLKTNKAPKR